MHFSPILLIHICSGTIGCLSGGVAVIFKKGSRGHALAGNVFVISMLTLAFSGTTLAIVKREPTNILGGIFTFYLTATAWMTARRRKVETGLFDWAAFLSILAFTAVELTFGMEAVLSQTGTKYGYPPGPYFFIGSVALIALVGDVRMLFRKGITGTQRIARHLWRMCFAWFIASASIFLARPHLFPAILQKMGILVLLSILPLLLLFFWITKIRVSRRYEQAATLKGHEVYPARA